MLCLKHKRRGIVRRRSEGVNGPQVRYHIVTREGFWRFYNRLRRENSKVISYNLVETGFEPSICPQCFIDDAETARITNMAFGWERTGTPPWEVYSDADRGEVWGLCNVAWAAKEQWSDMNFKRKEKETQQRQANMQGQGRR